MKEQKFYLKFIKQSAISEALTGKKTSVRPDENMKDRPFFIDLHLKVEAAIEKYKKERNKK